MKMRKTSKIICLLLVIAMVGVLFVGCETGGEAEANDNSQVQAGENAYKEFKKFVPEITLYTDRFIESEDEITNWDNAAYNVWCRENLGINWQPKVIAATEQAQKNKINLLAQSNDLPDVLAQSYDLLPSLCKDGYIKVLQTEIENYGSPLTKYIYLEEYQEVRGGNGYIGYLNEEGKFYAVPLILDPLECAFMTKAYYRKDILNELGYEVPTSVAELTDVMTAYVQKYNKPAVVFEPLMWGTAGYWFSLFDAHPGYYYPQNGEIVYGGIQPEMKTALATFADWYKKGIISKNFDTTSWDLENQKLAQGDYFITNHETFYPNWMQTQLEKNGVTGAEIAPLPFIRGANGEVNEFVNQYHIGWVAAITKNSSDIATKAIIYEMNENLESQLRNYSDLREKFEFKYDVTEPQEPLNAAAIAADPEVKPQYNYAEKDIGPGFLNEGGSESPSISYGYSRATSLRSNAASVLEAYTQNDGNMDAIYSSLTGSAKSWFLSTVKFNGDWNTSKALYARLVSTAILAKGLDDGVVADDKGWTYKFLTESNGQYSSTLDELSHQIIYDIIKGERPIDDFDKFVNQWKSNGGDIILAEKNALYQQMLEQGQIKE